MAYANPKNGNRQIGCPHCKAQFTVIEAEKPPAFCLFCGKPIEHDEPTSTALDFESESQDMVTLIQGHIPKKGKVQFNIGPYQVLESIGRGGMGEVLLAYDTVCGRRIALKRIRPDLLSLQQIQNRFLKEARVTSQLTHPAIIPIYSIHKEQDLAYYTMPFVEGETLKQILRKARRQEKKGETLDYLAGSIPALIRVFIAICQAVGYAHSKAVLHRDLKPENIIIGKYGEVMILDWGLAKLLKSDEEKDSDIEETAISKKPGTWHHLTRLGKVVGTVSYMAPERAMGQAATIQTDIYALGVILYQILTLRLPFRRSTLKEYRTMIHLETLVDPAEIAPYRDVPKILSTIALKCLAANPLQRYISVDDLIRDLESYIEGRTDWFKIAELKVSRKEDWEFQENILIAEHTAITRNSEMSEWVSLMISKASFAENICLEAHIKLGESSKGIGLLFNIPEATERKHINDGYCLWLGSDTQKTTRLLKSSHEVLHAEEIFLNRQKWYHLKIEKIENTIHFYLDDVLQFSYIGRMPIVGTHIGLLSRDADFEVENFYVYIGSQNIMVNCLAIPDAFLAHKDYQTALSEYRRIGYAFAGRAEGREAILRAGITMLEQAKNTSDLPKSFELFDASMSEFERLHRTAGAPLEYLGKALAYQAMKDNDEEIKCFELACRRYPHHPLLHVLEEQAIFRMQESSRVDRKATYNFLLLTLRFIPRFQSSNPVQKLIQSLKKHWETLPFLLEEQQLSPSDKIALSIPLAFWLDKPYILEEILDDLAALPSLPVNSVFNALFCLKLLGNDKAAEDKLALFDKNEKSLELLQVAFNVSTETLASSIDKLNLEEGLNEEKLRILEFFLNFAIDSRQTQIIHNALSKVANNASLALKCCDIWAYLLESNWQKVGELLHAFPFEFLSQEKSLLYFLYGCWLLATEGQELAKIHFSGVFDVPYPRTYALGSHFLSGKLGETWFQKAFAWEKMQLARQLELYNSIRQ